MEALFSAIQWRDPAPLAALRPDVPPAVEELVHRLLEKEPARRYEDARALAPALETLRVEATAAPAPADMQPAGQDRTPEPKQRGSPSTPPW
jgi:hypothetical protein